MRASWLSCVLTLAMWLAAGCSTALASPPEKRKPLAEKGGEQVSRGIIQEGLETLDTPESRARLQRILDSQEMRDTVQDLAASLTLGVIDGVRGAEQMEDRVAPAIGRLARRVVGSAIDASLTDGRIGRIEILGEHATQGAVRGLSRGVEQDLGPAIAATIEQDIGPALALVIERDLLPAIARGVDTPEMRAAMSSLSRSIAADLVGGAGDAIGEDEKAGKTLTLFGSSVALGYAIALFVAFALGTLSVVLTVMLVRNSRRLRKLTAEPITE